MRIEQGDRSVVVENNQGEIKTGDEIHHHYAQSLPPALHQLPPPPADFTGREAEIAEMRAALENAPFALSCLHGMGGVGKTALALKLADEIKERYPDAQFYLDLRGVGLQPLTPAEAMARVIHAYYPGAALPESEAELRGLYLSALHDQRALLLMDNARDENQVAPLIPPTGCAMLVTSRQYFTLPGLVARSLYSLPPDDSCKLLLAIAPRIGELAGDIAKLCGHLPLALRLAGSAIAKLRNLKPADYAQRLAGAQERLQLIEASLSLSYELLSEDLRLRWRSLAVFPGNFDDAGAGAVWEVKHEEAQDLLGELIAFSLVEWNEAAERYRLHDLARVFADSRLSEAERDGGRRSHAKHYQKVLAAADALYSRGGDEVGRGLALFDEERANIEAGHAWATELAGTDETAEELCVEYPNAGANVLDLRQNPRELVKWFNGMLVSARRLGRQNAEADALGNLGVARTRSGEVRQAIENFEQFLEIARNMGDRKREGNALSNLGTAYSRLGEIERAIECYKRGLEIFRDLGNLAGVSDVVGNLGGAYYYSGQTGLAIEFYNQGLAITRETGDRRGEYIALNNLGLAYLELGETDRAIERFEQCLASINEIGDWEVEASLLNNLGLAYAAKGEARRAIVLHEQGLKIALDTGDRRLEGRSRWAIASALAAIGDMAQAIISAELSLTIYEQIEDPRAAGVRNILAKWKRGDHIKDDNHAL